MIYGNQNTVQLVKDSAGGKRWALEYKPVDYDPAKKYPLLFHLNGLGEGGTTETDLQSLIKTGLPQLIANGMKPEAKDKAGVLRQFIVLSPQASNWSWGAPGEIVYMIADAIKKYSIDQSLIFIAGLSAGGSGAWQCVTNDATAKLIAGVIPLSPAGFDASTAAAKVKANNLAVWSACGDLDDKVSYAYAKMFVDNLINAGLPARFTTMKGQGHTSGAWNPPMQMDFATNPNNTYGQTTWEWMLANPKAIAGTVIDPPPVVTPPVTPTKTLIATIVTTTKVYSDGSYDTNTVKS